MIESLTAAKPQYPIKAEVYRNLNYDLPDGLSAKKHKTQITVSDLMTQNKDSALAIGV